MPKQSTDYLLSLIKRMSPAEKRHFKILVNRNSPKEEPLFLQLFDFIDRKKEYVEEELLEYLPGIKKTQLANVKANLYKQILSSLRWQMRNNVTDINLREQLDYARVLYLKGLYNASLTILERTRRQAKEKEQYSLLLNILEFEKHIESLYITGSMHPKAQALTSETQKTVKVVKTENQLSDLSISLYGLYLQDGYVKNQRDQDYITEYFKNRLPDVDESSLGFYGRMHLYQSYVWYYNMVQNFSYYYRYAQKWLELFLEDERWIQEETSLCIKGYHNVLNGLFMCGKPEKFKEKLSEFKNLEERHNLNFYENQLSSYKLFETTHDINLVYLNGNYEESGELADQISETILYNTYSWDNYRIMMFDYKVACIYFGANQLDKCIFHLNRIINDVRPKFRGDIQCFARILSIIAHFDLGNEELVSYQVRSTYRFISKMEHVQKVHKEIFSFLRRTSSMSEDIMTSEFKKLKRRLELLKKDPYERRPFLYLDIISWLDSKIEGITMAEAVRRNAFFG